jgi:hypothetical protein
MNQGLGSGNVKFDIKYKNPSSFGSVSGNKSTKPLFNGLLFSLQLGNFSIDSQISPNPDPNTKDIVLSDTNEFYNNVYQQALTTYYGGYGSSGGIPSGKYLEYRNAGNSNPDVFRAVENVYYYVMSNASGRLTSLVPKSRTSYNPPLVKDLTGNEASIVTDEVNRLIDLVMFLSPSGTINPSGMYEVDSNLREMGKPGANVQIHNKKLDWLAYTPQTFLFGLSIVNSDLTIGTSDALIFPFTVSDVQRKYVGISSSSTASGAPGELSVTATYYEDTIISAPAISRPPSTVTNPNLTADDITAANNAITTANNTLRTVSNLKTTANNILETVPQPDNTNLRVQRLHYKVRDQDPAYKENIVKNLVNNITGYINGTNNMFVNEFREGTLRNLELYTGDLNTYATSLYAIIAEF